MQIKNYSISPELFTRGFRSGTGPCSCTSTCCEGGVYADVRERDTILSHRAIIAKYMDETQSTDERDWFENEEHVDPDFPSGRCVGTREVNNKCAFLNRAGRCTLQVAAMSEGMHRWAFKPLFCILYPIEISDNMISFDEMLQDEESCCSTEPYFDIPLFEACKDELTHLVGEDGFARMKEYYESMQQASNQENTR
jgi:hypothetical protein